MYKKGEERGYRLRDVIGVLLPSWSRDREDKYEEKPVDTLRVCKVETKSA
jgi:hypothetical protein